MLRILTFVPSRWRWAVARRAALARLRRDKRQGCKRALAQFKRKLGYTANLTNPRTHSERILARKLFDHDPRFLTISGKFSARTFIDDILGAGTSNALCVPVLAHVKSFNDLPQNIWQQDVILKCTHGSGMNCVVKAGDHAARKVAKKRINKWLGRVHAHRRFEWSYIDLEPSIIAEPLLDIQRMSDLKLYFYDGTLRFFMPENNSATPPEISLLAANWEKLPLDLPDFELTFFDKPDSLQDIIDIATPLAAGFDAIRVDFIMTQDRFYLGELTVYDGSGLCRWNSKDEDTFFGQYWQQPHLKEQLPRA